MRNLKKNSLDEIIKRLIVEDKKKFLCICVGMQLLLNHSDEGDCDGLKIIDGYCKKFLKSEVNNVPHIGWGPVTSKHEIFNYNSDFAYWSLDKEGEKLASLLKIANLTAIIEEK